jgi:hypothetical protein
MGDVSTIMAGIQLGEECNLNSCVASRNYDFRHKVSNVALCGWPSNLLLNKRRVGRRNHPKPLPMRSKRLSTNMAGRPPRHGGTANLD